MQKYLDRTMEFLRDEAGASAVEYAILVSFLAAIVATAVALLGPGYINIYNTLNNAISAAVPG